MPTINLKSNKSARHFERRKDKKFNCINHQAVYNTRTWRNLRLRKLAESPLCEICKNLEILTLATEVHHKIAISNGKTIKEKRTLGFDYQSLQSICNDCHKKITFNNNH
jgi:5-methylcytosine-specific restriction endonuclease McrA